MKCKPLTYLFFAVLILFPVLLPACKQDRQPDIPKPNIILIMADDMGFSDIGCFGSEIHTPNLDKLAYEGLRMTQFYNASRCCPTRASLLTGLYQHQAGIGDMTSDDGIPEYQGYLNDRCMTMAEVLKDAGYSTYISGKWHVGEKEEHWPIKRGFDKAFGLIDGASNYYNLNPYRINARPRIMADMDERYYPPDSGFYMTDAFGDNACRFIQDHAENEDPFFLYLPFTAPHWPLHALPGDIEKYLGKYLIGWDTIRQRRYTRMIEMGLISPDWDLSPRDQKVEPWDQIPKVDRSMWDRRMAVYAAMIDRLDQNIGRLLEALKENDLYDNTLIVFIADNGGCHEWIKNVGNYLPTDAITGGPESFDSYQHHWANVSNTPFRWFKHWVHEGGISTPFIAWYPAMIEEGRLDQTNPGHIIDLMSTFIELSGAQYPGDMDLHPVQGQSLVPIFKGSGWENERVLFWEHEGNRALRKGDYKLVSRFTKHQEQQYTAWELYNIMEDRSELNDLSQDMPDVVKELENIYMEKAKEIGVLPFDKVLEIRRANVK